MENKKAVLPNEYLQDVLVRLAHHSSAIEGNTISLADTVSILLHNTIPGRVDKREFFEIENHRAAFEYLLEHVQEGDNLSISVIKGIHAKLTDRLLVNPGEFKKDENAIIGADFQTASSQQTPFLMQQWVDNLEYRLDISDRKEDKVSVIVEAHIEFERIHPFPDGNGRTGRMLMNYSLLNEGIAPLIIEGKDKLEYVNILAHQDVNRFSQFALKLIENEENRVQQFVNIENSRVKDDIQREEKIGRKKDSDLEL